MPKCNYQSVVTEAEKAAARGLGRCDVCNRTEIELRANGQNLQVCAVEHYSDIARGKTVVLTIPLCPECHRRHHLNARMQNEPCPFVARRSWETLV